MKYLQRFIVALILFSTGCICHFGLLSFFSGGVFFGDHGDGLFNLWVLQVAEAKLRDMSLWSLEWLHHWPDAAIFWPENDFVYTRSDNLFIYAPLFSLLKLAGLDILQAYGALSFILLASCFVATYVLLRSLTRACFPFYHEQTPAEVLLLLCTFICVFSQGKMRVMNHWQTLSYGWVVWALVAMLKYSLATDLQQRLRRVCLVCLAIFQTCLMLSAMYYAVLCSCLVFVWFFGEILSRPQRILLDLRKVFFGIVPFAVICCGVAFAYMNSPRYVQDLVYTAHVSARLENFYIPPAGLFRQVLERVIPTGLATVPGEVTGYMGLGVLWACLFFALRWLKAEGRRLCRSPIYITMLGCFLVSLGGLQSSWFALLAWIPLLMVGLVWARCLRTAHQQRDAKQIGLLFAVVSFVVIFGVAMGPFKPYMGLQVQPSIWGVLGALIPGVGDLRAVGRLATVAQQPLVLALLWGFFSLCELRRDRQRSTLRLWQVAFLLVAVQLLDNVGLTTYNTHMNAKQLTPSRKERLALADLQGPLLVFPTQPHFRSTQDMVYFSHLEQVNLVNGYSAFVTQPWQRMMDLALHQHREPSLEQLEYAQQLGVFWIAVLKTEEQSHHDEVAIHPLWELKLQTMNYRFYQRQFEGIQEMSQK
ncbi:MAG: hypothetical protein OXT67_00920 [Zetaproteobacteria bacterium]|nr:hypothetical protein [Zetaproteobacteria bacterium]